MIHDDYGPSSLWRAYNCPASVPLCKKAKAEGWKSHLEDDADEGTDKHELAAGYVAGKTSTDDPFLDETIDRLVERKNVVAVEKNYSVMHNFGEVTHGTLDVGMIFETPTKKVGKIIDWKFGYQPDDDETHWQQACYAVGFAQQHGLPEVVAEAHWLNTGHVVTVELESVQDVLDTAAKIAAMIEYSKASPTVYKPGSYCRKCLGAGKCPALQEEVKNLPVVTEDQPLSPEKLQEYADLWKTRVEPFGKMVMKRLRQAVEVQPQLFDGWEIKAVNGTRSCNGIEVERVRKVIETVVTDEEFDKHVDTSLKVAPLQKTYVELAVAGNHSKTKKEANAEFKSITKAFVNQGISKRLQRVSVKKGLL